MQVLWISIAGVLGVLARYLVQFACSKAFSGALPFATIFVNIAGSFAIGLLYVLATDRMAISEIVATALMVGLLGGFTTFSSFSLDTIKLWQSGQSLFALGYVLFSVFGSLLATALGISLARN